MLCDIFCLRETYLNKIKYKFFTKFGTVTIDNELLKMIEQHLGYSDIPLNKISAQLHFSSIYAFSRYYRQHREISLSEFRRKKSSFENSDLPDTFRNTQ